MKVMNLFEQIANEVGRGICLIHGKPIDECLEEHQQEVDYENPNPNTSTDNERMEPDRG